MKHIYFEFDKHKYYIEVNNQRYAVRQIIEQPNGKVLLSSRENVLAENQVSIDEDDTLISETEFNEVWNKEANTFADTWDEIKKQYPLGSKVSAIVQYFYPQGIICDVEGVLMVTIDESYMPGDLMLYPKDVLEGVVIGYDEENMWVKFEAE